jgi:hypothetical protein
MWRGCPRKRRLISFGGFDVASLGRENLLCQVVICAVTSDILSPLNTNLAAYDTHWRTRRKCIGRGTTVTWHVFTF